jgi:hypothetical protein
MLFQIQENFVDIVRERPYKNVLTVMATNFGALKEFYVRTPARVLPIAHHLYRGIIHIADSNLPFDVDLSVLEELEVVERLTPAPVTYYYEYAHPDLQGNMTFAGSYCWADELEKVEQSLVEEVTDMIGDPLFIPIFRVPASLTKPGKGYTGPSPENPDKN